MTTVYIDLREQGGDPEQAVLIAAHREVTKIVFIGEDARANKAAKDFGVEFERKPAGTAIPVGVPRVFCGDIVTSY